MKTISLMLGSLALAAAASATSLHPDTYQNHARKGVVERVLRGPVRLNGLSAAELGSCPAYWLADLLNLARPMVARPDNHEGVVLVFNDEESLQAYAKAAHILGDRTTGYTSENEEVEIQVCAKLGWVSEGLH